MSPSRAGIGASPARVVVVTGASSGIGRATAREAAACGDHVVLVARGREALEATAAECARQGAASTLVIPADVGSNDQVRDVVRQVLERHRRIDVFVNSAGVVAYGRTEEVPVEVFDAVLRTNLLGSVNVARHVLPVLRAQGQGSLVLIGSVIGHIAVPSMSAYVLSKWGVRALARQLKLENRDRRGVHVVYVAPGGVDTPIYEQAANEAGFMGRPPPPVSSPERAGRQILRRAGRSRTWPQLTLANDVIRIGYSGLPMVYDVLVGPLFRVAALDHGRPVGPTTGNVLCSRQNGNALHGEQGNAVRAVLRNLRARRQRTSTAP